MSRNKLEANRPILKAAFAALRQRGYVARQNFSCCGTCAAYELSEIAAKQKASGKVVRGCVYYHQQDHDCLLTTGRVYIGFGPAEWSGEILGEDALTIGREVVAEMHSRGLCASWSGDVFERIRVDLTQGEAGGPA